MEFNKCRPCHKLWRLRFAILMSRYILCQCHVSHKTSIKFGSKSNLCDTRMSPPMKQYPCTVHINANSWEYSELFVKIVYYAIKKMTQKKNRNKDQTSPKKMCQNFNYKKIICWLVLSQNNNWKKVTSLSECLSERQTSSQKSFAL